MPKNGFDSIYDLPHINAHPSAEELISILDNLALEPPSWDHQSRNGELENGRKIKINEVGVPSFLTSIVGSLLSWIHEDRREEIWEAASKRLSERCGRTGELLALCSSARAAILVIALKNGTPAIPSVSRTFVIPDPFAKSSHSVSLHEPSLTSDNLGHKTWLASYLLAKRLPFLRHHLPQLHSFSELRGLSKASAPAIEPFKILELGAGTGLVGITVAAVFPSASVHLTDLPAITPNLEDNVSHNIYSDSYSDESRKVTVGVLDWSDLPSEVEKAGTLRQYDLIIAADPLYSPLHPRLLVNTIALFLKTGRNARVIVELPLREVYAFEVDDFRKRMNEAGFNLVEDGKEVGIEDWECTSEGDQQEITCWWGVWEGKDDKVSGCGH